MVAQVGTAESRRMSGYGICVVLMGGPYARHWYTQQQWRDLLAAERWGIEVAHENRPPVLSRYEHTRKIENAHNGLVGEVWKWPVEPAEERRRRR